MMKNIFKPILAFCHDTIAAPIAFYLALYLRLGDLIDDLFTQEVFEASLIFTATAILSNLYFRLYRGIWRYASLSDLTNIIRAVSLTVLAFVTLSFFITRLADIPRSVPIISWFILISLLAGSRLFYRLIKDKKLSTLFEADTVNKIHVLLIGDTDEADLFIRSLAQDPNSPYKIHGLVTENKGRIGRQIRSIPILGTIKDLPHILETQKQDNLPVQRLIIAKSRKDTEGHLVKNLFNIAQKHGLTLSRMPKLTDFQDASGDKAFKERPIDIEDLLGRPQKNLNHNEIQEFIKNQKILITGAGGSIGEEICYQVARLNPTEITIIEQCEFNLYKIDQSLRQKFPGLKLKAYLGDVREKDQMDAIFKTRQPEIIFHAAALKHVPLSEQNPRETVMTNIFGTKNIADLCAQYNAKAMVQISTDKAVNPTNIMGATKRAGEAYCQALDAQPKIQTRFLTVRFGNVLGSTGSVIPLFQKQLAAGGPLTVTHPEIKRFFMTIKEAVKLVLQASAHGIKNENEKGGIFVLDMGESIKITHLAEQMIRLSGYEPYKDIEIKFTGLREGEKLFEELFDEDENLTQSGADGVLSAHPRQSDLKVYEKQFKSLQKFCQNPDKIIEIVNLLQTIVPEYQSNQKLIGKAS